MTLKYLCAAAVLAGCLLPNGDAALAARGMTAPRAGTMMVTPSPVPAAVSSSATSGALPSLPSSGAIPPSPTSAALPSLPRSTLSILGQSLTPIPQPQMPLAVTQPALRTPYQPPCGTYPLPQC